VNAEKEIVETWLNSLGFFTIRDINAGKNIISIIGIKLEDHKVQRVVHVEIACSISNEVLIKDCLKKFDDARVKSKVKSVIKTFVGKNLDYDKVLVTTSKKKIRGVEVVNFSDVLKKVVDNLDKQRYDNQTIRTLQLMKFIYLKKNRIYKSISKKRKREILLESLKDRSMQRELINSYLMQEIVKKYLRKQKDFLLDYLRSMSKKKKEELIAEIKKKPTERVKTKNIPLKEFLK